MAHHNGRYRSGHCCDYCKTGNRDTQKVITRWMWIIREYDIRKHPNEVFYRGFLTDMNAAMQLDVVAKL